MRVRLGGLERGTPARECVRPCLRLVLLLVVVVGLPMAPVGVMWLLLPLPVDFADGAPPTVSETVRECAGCHLELAWEGFLRGREGVLLWVLVLDERAGRRTP